MKHELLEEVWRVRDQIGAECGYDPKRLAKLVRREERKAGKRLVAVGGGSWRVVAGIGYDVDAKERLRITTEELLQEQALVRELIPA